MSGFAGSAVRLKPEALASHLNDMADCFTKTRRSEIMASIRSCNTSPEKNVRSLIHRLGYRFRLHQHRLPGTPDIVLPRLRKIVLVHGCFWHKHQDCPKSRLPKTNTDFWANKQDRNALRDRDVVLELRSLGWETLIVWQCELRKIEHLERRLKHFLKST